MRLFETARLDVRPLRLLDAAALFPILSDAEVMRHLEPPYTRPQTEAFIRECGLSAPPLVYGVVEKASTALIGHLIFHPFETAECYELGWVLARESWGKGYASELTEGAAAYAKGRGIKQLVIECLPENAASIQVAVKCGFCPAGEAEGLRRFVRSL